MFEGGATMWQRIEPYPGKLWEVASRAARVGDTIYLAGQVGIDADGKIVGDDMRSQARKALRTSKIFFGRPGQRCGTL
jgi:enamine deaminase RidA (YjgF/YER057c/UK114 family)